MSTTLRDRLGTARTTAGQARERSHELSEVARERAHDLGAQARDRAQDLGGQAKGRAQDLVTAARPAGQDAAASFGDLVAAVVTALAAIPTLVARVLRLATVWVDRASEQGRDVAARIEPSTRVRRRRRARTAAWAGGAFGVGFCAGWLVHDRLSRQQEAPYVEPGASELDGATPGTEAKVIPARRRGTDAG